jgi:hypothetical protein
MLLTSTVVTKEEKSFLKLRKNRRHLRIGHIIRRNEFVVNILEGAISGNQRLWEDLDFIASSKSPETKELTIIQQ